jgi:rubrerythrin
VNRGSWTLADIAFDCVDVERVRPHDDLFLLLAGASFVETASDLYARNLVRQFQGDSEVSDWLSQYWEPEELQHGRALRSYVNHVWTGFDWQSAFDKFLDEHVRYCTDDELEATPGLEMAARCVVEMGTSTYYRAIYSISDEPVLRRLVGFIQRDEVRHYRHFHRYFQKYDRTECNGRARILGALGRRLHVLLRSDVERGSWYPYQSRYPDASRDGRDFRRAIAHATATVRDHYPAPMAVRMLLKPLALPRGVNGLCHHAAMLTQRLILH